MRFWIDFTHPAHVNWFAPVAYKIRANGYKLLLTVRDDTETVHLLRYWFKDFKVVGSYGGPSLEDKLKAYARRVTLLSKILRHLKVGALLTHSPDSTWTAYYYNIPIVVVTDEPHAKAVSKLTLPLADRVISPSVIGLERLLSFGACREKIMFFKGVTEYSAIKMMEKIDVDVIRELNLDSSRPVATVRLPAWKSSFLQGNPYLPLIYRLIKSAVRYLLEKYDCQVVILPRDLGEAPLFKEYYRKGVIIPSTPVYGLKLFQTSKIVITGGSATARESSLLGTPTLLCMPPLTDYRSGLMPEDEYLRDSGLIFSTYNEHEIRDFIDRVMSGDYDISKAVKKVTSNFEDPSDLMVKAILSVAKDE